MQSYAIFVHGFNVKDDGQHSIDTLKPAVSHFRNIHAVDYDYGWLGLFGVRFLNWRLGKALSGMIQNQDILVGHSNGCAVIYNAVMRSQHGCVLAFFVAPALDSDVEFPPEKFRRVVVLHSKHDIPVRLSKYLPFHTWGEMGAYGAKHPNVKNIDCTQWAKGHSAYFAPENQPKTRAILAAEIRNAFATPASTKLRDSVAGMRNTDG
jgi:hypothetical protein